MRDKVIISAALSGAAPTKPRNPNVPYTPDEYVKEAIRAYESGAAIVHVHFRDPSTGNPTVDPAIMTEVVQGIRENTKLLINLSTGLWPEAPLAMRRKPIEAFAPEIASLNPGTMNFALVSHRTGEIVYDFTFPNPFKATIDFGHLMKEKGIKAELECFDLGHVHNVLFLDRFHDITFKPMHFSFVLGVAGGVQCDINSINAYLQAMPPGSTWQGIGVGPFCLPVAMISASLGGHFRVGLEDSLFVDYTNNVLARGNWELVEKGVQIAKLAGREVASPEEARELLSLPARD
jgi:uncharacterized protein (DUF849 family)